MCLESSAYAIYVRDRLAGTAASARYPYMPHETPKTKTGVAHFRCFLPNFEGFMDALSISVVRYVKEASRILAYPFFSVAYFLQSGGPIWYFKLNFEYAKNFFTLNNMDASIPYFIWLLFVKTFLSCSVLFVVTLITRFIAASSVEEGGQVLAFLASIIIWALRLTLVSFGLIGIFLLNSYPELKTVNIFWFVASIVWGLSLYPAPESEQTSKTG